MTRPRTTITALLTPVMLAGLLTACSTEETPDVEQMAPEQATSRVKELADGVLTASGSDAFSKATENVSPCDGKLGEVSDPEEIYYIQGIYQLRVPAAQQKALFAGVRQHLVTEGMQITDERTFADGNRGDLGATQTDGYAVSLRSGEDPLIAVLVSSPCYRKN